MRKQRGLMTPSTYRRRLSWFPLAMIAAGVLILALHAFFGTE